MYCLQRGVDLLDQAVSPFLIPTPYGSSEKPSPTTLSLPLYFGLGGEPGQDHVVGGDRVDLAAARASTQSENFEYSRSSMSPLNFSLT